MVAITPRLRQLLLLLSSDQPGEVAAAAAAITRTLEKTGASWHDLVDGLVKDAPQPKQSPFDSDTDRNKSASDWRTMRAFCLSQRDRLRERELEFLEDIGRWRGDLTEKQHGWLVAIYARLRR
jgi:hypothetical protein